MIGARGAEPAASGHGDQNRPEAEEVESTVTFIAQQELRRVLARPAFLALRVAVILRLSLLRSRPLFGSDLGVISWLRSLGPLPQRRHSNGVENSRREREMEKNE